jgi:hypothetical protein
VLFCTFRYRTAAHLHFMKAAAAQLDVMQREAGVARRRESSGSCCAPSHREGSDPLRPLRAALRLAVPLIIVVVASTATSGCTCESPDSRNLMFEGLIPADSGVPLGSASVTFSETRGDPSSRRLHMQVRGPVWPTDGPLAGHVLFARLLGVADTVIRTYGATDYGRYPDRIIVTVPERIESDAATRELRRALMAGPVVIELTTDLPGMPVIRIQMRMVMDGSWQAGGCT